MASLLSLVVNGVTRLNNDTHGKNVYADKHITNGGSNLQFVKGDGSLDNTLYAKSSDLSNYLPLAGGWMDTGAQIYFKGLNQSTSVWGSIGYRANSGNGSNAMHNVTSPNNTGALYITTNGYDSANDYGGLAIDNDGVTAFGAGDSGSVFRVINEDNVGDGAQFYVTKASGAVVKKSLTASNFVSNEATGTQPYACTSTTLNTNLNADYLDGMHESSFVRWGGYDGTFGTHCPADTVKSKFTAATMPNGNLLAYDTAGNEYTLLMTCRPDILHGTALKWGYPDRYIRILRFTNGTAATTDWEKIAAGYADSAGNADTLDDKHANELFTSLANSGNDLSITIGGTTKTLTPAYASVSGSCTGNAASATKLQTSRKLWSQPFDGTADVNEQIDIIISKQNSSTAVPSSSAIMLGSNGSGHTGYHAGIAFNALRYGSYINHIHAWVGLGPYTTTASAECYPLVFATNGSTTTNTAPTERMRITPSGLLGIGTDSPKGLLSVYSWCSSSPSLGGLGTSGTVEFGASGAYGTYFWTTGAGKGFIQQGRTDGTATSYDLILQPLGSNVGISTSSPSYKLDVNGTLGVSGTSTFTGKTTHNGGIDTTFLSASGDITGAGNLSITGASTFTGVTTHNGGIVLADTKAIKLRTHASYVSGIGYDTSGNECIALWAKNSVTRLRWNAGVDMSSMTSGTMMGITPDFEISKADGTAKGYIGGNLIWTKGNDGSGSGLDADLLDGNHVSSLIFHKSYGSLSALPSESNGWYKICTIGDMSGSPAIICVRAYAHSSAIFTVSKGYSTSGNITLLQYCSSGNGSYAYIEGARLLSDGVVEVLIHKPAGNNSTYVNISASIFNADNIKLNDSLTLDTTSPTIIDSRIFRNASIMANTFVGNLIGTADVASVARSLASDGTHIMYAQNNDEVNFGGSYAGSTIYFGYRAAGSKPVPSAFVFGTSAGTATLKGGGFIKNGSSNDYVLLGGGGHKALTDFSMAHSHPYLPSAQVSIEQNANDDWIHEYALNNVRAHVHNTSGLEWQYLIGISTGKTYGSILRTSYGNGTPRLQIKGIYGGSWTAWREVSYDGHTHSQYLTALPSHTHTKSQITDFAHTHTKSDITDFAHTHTSITDGTMTVYSHYSNEVNFGGTNASSTIYFGYRAMDSKPIPASFVFGSSTGTATVTASGFKKTGSSDSYVLLGAGGHKALSDFSMAHSHPYLPLAGGTMTGTIVTPGNDTVVIKPAKNNYDQIGGEGIAFWKIYATNFYGTFNGNATSATNSTYATYLSVHDVRSATRAPSYFTNRNVTAWFNNTGTPTSDWYSGLHVKGWDNSGSSGYCSWEIASYSSTGTSTYSYPLWYRSGNNGSWSSWYRVVTTGQTSGNAGHYGWPVYLSSGQITECSFGVLWAGYIYRTSLSETAWYASSSYSPTRYNASGASNTVSITVSVNGSSTSNPGLMTLKLSTGFAYAAFATTNRIYNSSTAYFYPNTNPVAGRSAGMGDYWINCSNSTVYIKKFKQQNGNNDKWADTDLITTTTSDGNKPPMSFYLIIFGTFYAP